jgi:hypothetical protein
MYWEVASGNEGNEVQLKTGELSDPINQFKTLAICYDVSPRTPGVILLKWGDASFVDWYAQICIHTMTPINKLINDDISIKVIHINAEQGANVNMERLNHVLNTSALPERYYLDWIWEK